MEFRQITVGGFFGRARIKYIIPSYQRAYSWETEQWQQFFDDLYEHRHSTDSTPYSLGNVLLQTIKKDSEYGIIDGQQRITTISIFVRALLNLIAIRGLETEDLCIEDEVRVYFKDFNTIKLHPVEYDVACYNSIIIENKDVYNYETPSQKRMLGAKKWFIERLNAITDIDILSMYHTLTIASVNTIELSGNKESALMFELQNNRGKELTNLERLKSYLLYQLYVYSDPNNVDPNVDYISGLFAPIYKITNDLNVLLMDGDYEDERYALSEDNVLLYHSYAYNRKGFGYRRLGDTFDEFKDVADGGKVRWIKDYVYNLNISFSNIKKFLGYKDKNLTRLKRLGIPSFVYPFILKGMQFWGDDRGKMSELFRILERLSFRYKLIGSRADIRSRLSEVIKNFNGDLLNLEEDIRKKINDEHHWSDQKALDTLNGYMYGNPVLHYLLWEYEETLQPKGYSFGSIVIEDESIEHISPQTEDDEWVSPGYEIDERNHYTPEYRAKYINMLGNLMIISKSHNSSIGNKPFSEKIYSYKNNPLLQQQKHIPDFIQENNPIWDSVAIDKRQEALLSFSKNRWL